ncbi:serine hydrolase domain-containing protein [Streptomyces hesseae]|uniref:Serine hydrolase domain-containing protein n=1 Tax=Streptomyces hesseae TaxID=3075519 RepID=A0ABU2SGD8_9ACTN|nr:serine hydrolase domain-containing protein [Streptomyces sp. DSM 40473]MDT0448041.1 serine hydrolase domain-containing protein [Streptomyces sp. DSM 40473]
MEIHGICDDRFGPVREAFTASLRDGRDGSDVGASVAVLLDGEPVVDLWGGYTDRERTRPWRQDTITNVWSLTKTMTALCALVLADRRELDLSAPVAKYWPEFGTAGKDGIEIRHVLGHTAGLPDWDRPMALDDLCDWEKATSLLARQSPRWTPGTASGYHRFTHGFLIGEVIRRVCGQSHGVDLVLGIPVRFGVGYALNATDAPIATPSPRTCYWGGRGGSLVVNDLDVRVTVAYVMNQMSHLGLTDPRPRKLLQSVYTALAG